MAAAKTATSPQAPFLYTSLAPLPTKTPAANAPQNMAASYFTSTPRLTTPHQPHSAKSPSPNYFSFQAQESGTFITDSPQHAKSNWSPPSSVVRSTAAASPSVVPVDQDPQYDAFRRQSEGRGAFNLGGLSGNFSMNAPPTPRPISKSSSNKTPSERHVPRSQARDLPPPPPPTQRRLGSLDTLDPASAELMRSPKRVLSPGSAAQVEPVRKGSPAHFHEHDEDRPHSAPRFKLPLDEIGGAQAYAKVQRSETLPETKSDESEQYLVAPQRVVTLLQADPDDVLILDLRVSTHYAKSHITSALNLCIPTTLLKRPSFNVQKLAETFKDEEQRNRFENWRNSSYIIVYDASSVQLKDALICMNMIKKFRSDGYKGALHIVKGGFAEFSKSFAQYVEAGVDAGPGPQLGGGPGHLGGIPVIGGCEIPSTDKPANPFFGNIRQNMDLIGGVGQIPVKHPQQATAAEEQKFPEWLKRAASDRDQGKKVSNKFEAIERREKKRMEDALSGKVSYGSSTSAAARPPQIRKDSSVQIAGIEKGNKNRYNNIWPFEHSRVRLQGVPKTGCDYFNANYVQAAWTNKRYISTQAPIPSTFDDFWNVVWQQDVRVIVMLTAEKEGAQVKAHNYWDQKQYGPLKLDFLSEKRASLEMSRIYNHQQHKRPAPAKRLSSRFNQPQPPLAPMDSKETSDQPYVIVRKFTLSHSAYPFEPWREVTQLQYSSWPDFGAPAHPAHLLGLVEQTDAVVRSTNKTHGSKDPEPEGERPVMVHCSAGCGRTGTFCTVDSVIDMLKRQRISKKKRQGTPMDIDKETPARELKPRRTSGGGGGDFFGSQYAASEVHEGEPIDGAWVDAEDVDLVEKTVEDFRHQRLSMVQSLRQFVLCYESVMEWLVDQSPPEDEQKGS